MGRFANFLWGSSEEQDVTPTFAIDVDSIDPAVFGLSSYSDPIAPAPRIDRRSAIQVGAVKRARDLIAGSIGQLPLDVYAPDRTKSRSTLLEQPEANVPRSVTMTRTVEDMLFEGIAWWRVVEFGWHGYPTKIKRLAPRDVDVDEAAGKVYVKGKHVPDEELIRFDSPNDALLVAGARAIRTCLRYGAAADLAADGMPPVDWFTPADPDVEPDDPQTVVDTWVDSRRRRRTAYVPAALDYHRDGWTPEQMKMDALIQAAKLEIANHTGVDPEELGVSTTSRTYANQFDRRKAFLDFTDGAYLVAIQDRLSMGDVTPRGYLVRFNLDAFLRSDALGRYQAYAAGKAVGALTEDDILEAEGKPLNSTQGATVDQPAASAQPVTNFDTVPELRLDAPGAQAFEVDVEKRTIKGLIVPYGVAARSNGQLWQFSQGTLKYADPRRVKLWIQHDSNRAVGVATELDDKADGMYGTFKVARGAAGDEALAYAEDGVLDGFSIGLGAGGKFTRKGNVNHAVEAPLMETSLTPAPSFDDARVHSVAASAAQKEGSTMTETVEETTSAPAVDFAALSGTITEAIAAGFTDLRAPQRETVAAGGAVEVVREELPYRFDGTQGAHGFLADIQAAYSSGDNEARLRLDTFMEEAFAVTSGNVSALNPTKNRPELYVPNLTFTRPLWDLVSTGTLEDKTPFTVPKFSSASGLVSNHTEGVEPTPGAFTATSQTVSPGPLSGKVEIVREVWDQGGSPQADGIIWGEMLNAWYEGLESRIATLLATTATAELNLAGVVDAPLQDALVNYYAGLQFQRGGNRFTATAADSKLFLALTAAKGSDGRKLFPVLGPVNATGQTTGGFDSVNVGSQKIAAAWALAQGANTRSYNFVPSSVWYWASAPKRFTFEYQVKSIDMAIWGYAGGAILRDSDVKPIDYDTADT